LKQYIVVPEPQRLKTQVDRIFTTFLIVRSFCLFSVLATIKLIHQANFKAGEISKVRTKGMLPAELEPIELPGPEF